MALEMKRVTTEDAKPPRRLIMRVGGLEKNGKTHFGFTAPGPLAIFLLDKGSHEGVIDKFIGSKEISVVPLTAVKSTVMNDVDQDEVKRANEKLWQDFLRLYYKVITGNEYRSIIIDTETQLYEIVRLAKFGKLTQVKSHHYTLVNDEYRAFVDEAFNQDKNVIFLDKMRKQYVAKEGKDEGQWNGKHEDAGWGDIGYRVMMNLRVGVDTEGDNFVEVVNCRANTELRGRKFYASEGEADFAHVAAEVYPDFYDITDWLV